MLDLLHSLLVAGLCFASLTMLGMALVNRARLAHVLHSWHPRVWQPWPYLFIVALGALWFSGRALGNPLPTWSFMAYTLATVAWAWADHIRNTIVITRYGVVRCLQNTTCTITWTQVLDYFVQSTPRGGCTLVILYQKEGLPTQRCTLFVPKPLVATVQTTLDSHLSERAKTPEQVTRTKRTRA